MATDTYIRVQSLKVDKIKEDFVNNKIIKSNPHGSIDIQQLELLEDKLEVMLPQEYREYLLKHNGGMYKNDTFYNPKHQIDYIHVHEINALVDEPKYLSLEDSYKVFNLDLYNNDYKFGKDYLSIMYDDGGDQITIKLHEPFRGSIYFWIHDDGDDSFIKIADSYKEFVNSLISDEEYMKRLKDINPEEYENLTRIIERRLIDIYLYNNDTFYFVPYSEIKKSGDMQPHEPVLSYTASQLNTAEQFGNALKKALELSRYDLNSKEFDAITKNKVFPLNNDVNFNKKSILIEAYSFGGINYDFQSTKHDSNEEFDSTGPSFSISKESSDEIIFDAFHKAMNSSE